MVLKRAIAFSLSLLTCSAQANNLCSLSQRSAEKTVKIQGVPGYFFKVHPDGDLISFIDNGHNSMIDLGSGKEYPTVGYIDPVWSPDGKFLTHPGVAPEGEEEGNDSEPGIQFYPGDKIIEATKNKSAGMEDIIFAQYRKNLWFWRNGFLILDACRHAIRRDSLSVLYFRDRDYRRYADLGWIYSVIQPRNSARSR
jgi:hypothetical protein